MGIGAAIIGSALIGTAGTLIGSSQAAKAQTTAADKSIALQKPYLDLGNKAAKTIDANLDTLVAPIDMSQVNLEQTPGYKFTLAQGMKAVNNSAAARGLGNSGAALKGAATYATGLADTTYQQQFANALANKTWTFNSLKDLIGVGTGAASSSGDALMGIGNAQGAAAIAGGNAIGSLGNALGSAYMAKSGQGAYSSGSLY